MPAPDAAPFPTVEFHAVLRRGVARQTWVSAGCAFVGSMLYELAKAWFAPPLGAWQPHAVTVVFNTVAATVAAHLVLAAQARLHRRLADERARRAALEGRQAALVEHARELTDAHRAAREREAQLRLVMQQLPAALWSVDADLRLTSAAGRGLSALGLPRAGAAGLHLREAFDVRRAGVTTLEAHLQALTGQSASLELRREGRIFEVQVEPLRDGGGAVTGALGLAVDITDRKRLEEQLTHQAFHDGLTGLANRALFLDRARHAVARAPRNGPATVLFLDLDNFKVVNDSLGHAEGDRLLQSVATRLVNLTRAGDTVARIGGDEFAVLLEQVADGPDAAIVADRILEALRTPIRLQGQEVSLRASIGIAHHRVGEDADELLRNADVAMHRAKGAGKGRHLAYEPAMRAAVVERLEIEADLRHAIDAGHLRLVYQPVVELGTGRVTCAEALLRWRHHVKGMVLPAAFIGVAEESGLIVEIGRWAVREACEQLRRWDADLDPGAVPAVAVNISGRQFEDGALVDDVAAALRETGVAPERLTLEITESVVMRRTDATIERLRALKALGVRLAIDDFGTGYSSLAYLQRFPIDILKIDKAFVDGVALGGTEVALARAIIGLGDALGLTTVAEGVERAEQRDALDTLGCRLAQGYLFARPLPAEEMVRMLR